MRVATIQMEMADRSKAENWERADQLLDRARGADIVLMPEIWNIGYFSFSRYRQDSEDLDGETACRGCPGGPKNWAPICLRGVL